MDRVQGQRLGRAAGVVLAVLMATGCASSDGPLSSAKVGQAERAVADAKQAKASVYAAPQLQMAENKLAAAKAAMTKEDYREAIAQADAAAADADYARAHAISERVRRAIDETKKNIQALRQELDKMPQ